MQLIRWSKASGGNTDKVPEAVERPADGLLTEVPPQFQTPTGGDGRIDEVHLGRNGRPPNNVADPTVTDVPDSAEPVPGKRRSERLIGHIFLTAHLWLNATQPCRSEHPFHLELIGTASHPYDHVRLWEVPQDVCLTEQPGRVMLNPVVALPPPDIALNGSSQGDSGPDRSNRPP